jgi:hypothetical protein
MSLLGFTKSWPLRGAHAYSEASSLDVSGRELRLDASFKIFIMNYPTSSSGVGLFTGEFFGFKLKAVLLALTSIGF